MKFRCAKRFLQAGLMLCLSGPVFGQNSPPVLEPQSLPTEQNAPLPEPIQPANPPAPITPPVASPPLTTPTPAPAKKKGPVDALKPGQFVWEKREVYEGPLKIVAVLDVQRIYVFQNDKLLGFSTISAGKKGKETPTGIFNILQKNIDHKSNIYSNAPMPYMQRLTWDGIALHGGYIPGYPASHGCIRLPHAFAKALFEVTKMDQEVVVLKNVATPVKRPEPPPIPAPSPVPELVPSPEIVPVTAPTISDIAQPG